jgi:hypothetical protein
MVVAKPISTSYLGTTPINFDIKLSGLPAGEYQCQVTVLDPTGKRASFWRGGFAISR